MSKLEIEKRYLCRADKLIKFLKKNSIYFTIISLEQFYLIANLGETLRYRKDGDTYIKNQKFGNGLIREEKETKVSKKEYKLAKKHNSGGVIKKLRYRFKIDNDIYELDVFKGKLKGLSILEIEFDNIYRAKEFKIPSFLEKFIIKDITNETIYSNAALSKSMKIPLRSDSKFSLNNLDEKELLKPKLDLYISDYENSKYAIENSLLRLFTSFEKNIFLFFEKNEYKYLNRAYKALLKIRAILKTFKEFIKETSYLNILLNVDILISSFEKTIKYNRLFRYILKENSSKNLESLLEIARIEKSLRDSLISSSFKKNIFNLKDYIINIKFKNTIEKPFVYIKDKILKRVQKNDLNNLDSLYQLKVIYSLFNKKFPYKKEYKRAKIKECINFKLSLFY